MRFTLLFFSVFLSATALGNETATHHFDRHGNYQQKSYPACIPKILAIAEKPMTLHFSGLPADWSPVVHIHRITSARLLKLQSVKAESTADGWQVTWAPPETRGPAQYEIRLEGEPKHSVRIESRPKRWIESTHEALLNIEWKAQGLSVEERTALVTLGIEIRANKAATASLEIRSRQGKPARRRIVWDKENPDLLVWRLGPAIGDLEARAPRWWISPAALATDHGLIRFLDLFFETPLSP